MWQYKQNELYHYGVKGMKWGKRTRDPADSLKYKIFPSRPTGPSSKRVEKNLGRGKYVGTGETVKTENQNGKTTRIFYKDGSVHTERPIPGDNSGYRQSSYSTPWANPFKGQHYYDERWTAEMNKIASDRKEEEKVARLEEANKNSRELKRRNTQKRVENAMKKAKLKKISSKLVGKGRKKLSETGAKKMTK